MWFYRNNNSIAITMLNCILALKFGFNLTLKHHGLLLVLKINASKHLGSFYWQNSLQVLDDVQSLLFSLFVQIQLYFALAHSFQDYWQRKRNAVFAWNTHAHDNMGNFFPNVFELPLSLSVRNLEFTFVEDLNENFLFRHLVSEHFEILTWGFDALSCVRENLINLNDLINVGLLFVPPICDFIPVTS